MHTDDFTEYVPQILTRIKVTSPAAVKFFQTVIYFRVCKNIDCEHGFLQLMNEPHQDRAVAAKLNLGRNIGTILGRCWDHPNSRRPKVYSERGRNWKDSRVFSIHTWRNGTLPKN